MLLKISKKPLPPLFVFLAVLWLVSFVSVVGYLIYERVTAPEKIGCTLEARICPDGTPVGRVPPACEFEPCPDTNVPEEIDDDVIPVSVTGYILATGMDEKTAVFQLSAESTAGPVKEMMVWTDITSSQDWEPYKTRIEIPVDTIGEFVYVQFRDAKGNESDVYSESPLDPYRAQ